MTSNTTLTRAFSAAVPVLTGLMALVPWGAHAAIVRVTIAQNGLVSVGQTILSLINGTLVPLIFAMAFIVFIWGAFRYFIAGAADQESQKKGRQLIIYGLIGFVVMFSLWGLVNIVTGTFGLDTYSNLQMPTI